MDLEQILLEYIEGMESMLKEKGNSPLNPNASIYGGDNLESEIQLTKERLERWRALSCTMKG